MPLLIRALDFPCPFFSAVDISFSFNLFIVFASRIYYHSTNRIESNNGKEEHTHTHEMYACVVGVVLSGGGIITR